MNRTFNAALLIYWFTVVTLTSFLVSCLSFFVPFHDIGEYTFRELRFEMRYYFFPTLLIFLGGGYLAALLFFTAGAYLTGRLIRRESNNWNWQLLVLNLILVLSPFGVWLLLGWELNSAFRRVVVPAYAAIAFLMHFVVFRQRNRHST